MKIKCYDPEILNEENKTYLLKNVEIYGKISLFLEKIRLAWPYLFMLVFIMHGVLAWQGLNEFMNLTSDILVLLFGLLLFIVLVKEIVKLNKKINNDFNGILINLVKEIVLIRNKEEKREFYERDKNTLLGPINILIRMNLDSGKDKKMYLKLYNNKYQEGEILKYTEYEQEDYVLLNIMFKMELNRLKRTYYFEEYFAIISREDYNKFKEIEEDYMVDIK